MLNLNNFKIVQLESSLFSISGGKVLASREIGLRDYADETGTCETGKHWDNVEWRAAW
jgi:hypothetical protein